jgi:GNAT superfamily N-acetyltransferase
MNSMAHVNRPSAMQTMLRVLSADLSCDETDLTTDGVCIRIDEHREGRFRFPIRERSLKIVTMGRGVVVSCSPDRVEWAVQNLGTLTRDQVFSAETVARIQDYIRTDNQMLEGPVQKFVCTLQELKAFAVPPGMTLSIFRQEKMASLYGMASDFPHALSGHPNVSRPDMLAVVAADGGKVVGIAGASADCELMWQIGVDVLPEYQGMGIGKAIVGTLTRAVLDEGVLPYYSTAVSNLQSRQLATRLGYRPAWIELYTR